MTTELDQLRAGARLTWETPPELCPVCDAPQIGTDNLPWGKSVAYDCYFRVSSTPGEPAWTVYTSCENMAAAVQLRAELAAANAQAQQAEDDKLSAYASCNQILASVKLQIADYDKLEERAEAAEAQAERLRAALEDVCKSTCVWCARVGDHWQGYTVEPAEAQIDGWFHDLSGKGGDDGDPEICEAGYLWFALQAEPQSQGTQTPDAAGETETAGEMERT